jgi:hypothetical protein
MKIGKIVRQNKIKKSEELEYIVNQYLNINSKLK